MRILLDHNLDWRLWELLQPHEVVTTRRIQWDSYENGRLLNVAQAEFDVLPNYGHESLSSAERCRL